MQTWIDWRSSVRKKARFIKREKAKGLPVKPLSPLEMRALRLFHKLDSELNHSESDLEDFDQITRVRDITCESMKSVKIERVMSVAVPNNTSSSVSSNTTPGTSTSSPTKPKGASSAVSSTTAIPDAIPVGVKDNNVPNALNNIILVPIESAPLFAIKDATPAVLNIPAASRQGSPKTDVPENIIKQEDISETEDSRNTVICESSADSFAGHCLKKTLTDQRKKEKVDEDFENSELPKKKKAEDSLGGLPLTLQNSILERLDTLNRNIETNTCALTILAKAINDSAETNMRAVNHLAKTFNNIGNMVGSYMELLKTNGKESGK